MNYSILTTTMITLFLIANTSPAQVSPPHTEEEALTIAFDDEIFCPELNAYVGAICNDENPLTHADKVNQDCECIGQLGFTCEASIPLDCNAGPITHSSLNSNSLPPTTTGYDIGTGGLYFSFIGIEGDMTIHASADFYLAMVTGYG